jgi:hypothetical protein
MIVILQDHLAVCRFGACVDDLIWSSSRYVDEYYPALLVSRAKRNMRYAKGSALIDGFNASWQPLLNE